MKTEEEKYLEAKKAFTDVWEYVETVYQSVSHAPDPIFKPVSDIRRELMKFMYSHMTIKPESKKMILLSESEV